MTSSNNYDVIIVGLGIMGSSALYQLSKRGVRALGIDRFVPPHNLASSHGDTRITREAIGEGAAYVPFVRRSNEIWREIETETKERILLETGGLIIAPQQSAAQFHANSDFVQDTVGIAKQHDIKYEVWSAEQMMAQYPVLTVPDNQYAYYEPASGVLRPEKCIQLQLDLAQQNGAKVHSEEIVLSYDATSSGVTVKTNRGAYAADKMILSAGSWMLDFLESNYRKNLKVYRQVIYWFEAEDITAFTEENFPFLIWIGNTMDDYFSAFPTPLDGIQGVKVLTEQYLENIHPNDLNRTVSAEEIEHMYQHFVKERLRGVKNNCIQSGVCMYTVTPDEHFIIDFHPNNARAIVASPCSGHGFKHSAAIGEVLSEMALDGQSQLDISLFSLSRFNN